MKTVVFRRHSRLGAPYNDYTKLSFDQYRDLGLCRVDPDIDKQSLQLIAEKSVLEELRGIDLIVCSPMKRAQQTSTLIRSLYPNTMGIRKSDTLKEIFFDLAFLLPRTSYAQGELASIREVLFRKLINTEHGVEPLTDLFQRIRALENMLIHSQYERILCITHGFYMRILHLYYLEHILHPEDVSVEKLRNVYNYDYLEGFTISLGNRFEGPQVVLRESGGGSAGRVVAH